MSNILLVDDNEDNLYLLRQQLELQSVNTLSATNGEEAIQLARQIRPDLILLDIQMPRMNGFETCRLLKQDQDTKHIPVIFLTAKHLEVDDRVRGLGMGADDYLIQPCDPEELMARIGVALRQKETCDHLLGILCQQENLANVGKLATAIAHEINNPLSVISSVFEICKEDIKDKKCLHLAENAIDRISRIVEQLLNFYRPRHIAITRLNLNDLLTDSLELLSPKLKERGIRILYELEEDLQPFQGSGQQLSTIFLNLIINACEAIKEGGILTLGSSNENNKIKVWIRDTGIGIHPEHLPHIFDPFYTTKEDGSGIGLFLVKNIMESNKGKVEVHSQTGQGTEFILTFPVIPATIPAIINYSPTMIQ